MNRRHTGVSCFIINSVMRKNENWTGTCIGYTWDGLGVVRFGDIVFFVPGLIEGEEAELSITAMKKNYGYARIVNLIKESRHRVKPACPVYRQCGGCQLMHMDLEEQKRFKEEKVANLFLQNAHMQVMVQPILEGDHLSAYRNKVQVPVQLNNGKTQMGFYANRTNRIVEYDTCAVQSDLSNEIVSKFKQWLPELGCTKSFRHVLIKHAHRTSQVMICMIVRDYPFNNSDALVHRITQTWPEVKSISCIVNRREDNVILDGTQIQIYGEPYIEEELLDCRFRISARSFFQINPYATQILYSTAIDYAQLTGSETVIDLYCGTGTIGILASRHAKKVYGIEVVADAIKDAKVNAELNDVHNIDFFTADAKDGARKLIQNNVKADVVIVDPPRKGCSRETLEAINTIAPKRLVYVSCDPATLARDCAILNEMNYEVQKVQPVDMFPGTLHIETIVLLQKLNS